MKTLDHRYYPHIVDSIWRYMESSEMPSLAVARGVCSSWRKRANRTLQRHLIVQPAQREGSGLFCFEMSVRSFDHPDASYPRWIVTEEDAENCYNEEYDIPTILELFENIRYLDLRGWHSRPPMQRASLHAFMEGLQATHNLRLARNDMAAMGHFYPEASTQVYFINGREKTECNPLTTDIARKLILNLDFPPYQYGSNPRGEQADEDDDEDDFEDEDEGTLWEWFSPFVPGKLKHLTFVFHPSEEERYTFRNYAETGEPSTVAERVMKYLGVCWRICPTNVVGLEGFFRSDGDFKSFRGHLYKRAQRGGNAPRKEVENLKIYTHEEYKDHVGRAAYNIFTVQ